MTNSASLAAPAREVPEFTTLKLHDLIPWDGNVRRTLNDTALQELAANIRAVGLLQSLTVRYNEGLDKYEVIAGVRRLKALQMLAEDRAIDADADIPCTLVAAEDDADEISLSENVVREPMHPADQFEAFNKLIANGKSVPEVAEHFGVEEKMVTRRLRLAKLDPAIVEAYRNGELTLEQVQAFTVSDDWQRQVSLLKSFPRLNKWQTTPDHIRNALTQGDIPGTDKRARLVGVTAYEDAGGKTRRDLFTDGIEGVYFLNEKILDKCVLDRLAPLHADILAEGWKWVEIIPDFDWRVRQDLKMEQEHCNKHVYPPELKDERDRLREEDKKLSAIDDDDLTEAQEARSEEISERIDEIDAACQAWPKMIKARGGAVIHIGDRGRIAITRGLIKAEDVRAEEDARRKKEKEQAARERVENGEDPVVSDAPDLSPPLMTTLSTYRSAAIAVALAKKPDIALRALVYGGLLKFFYQVSCDLKIAWSEVHYSGPIEQNADSPALEQLKAARAKVEKSLPEVEELWTWLGEQTLENLIDLLALTTAMTLDGIDHAGRGERSDKDLGEIIAKEIGEGAAPLLKRPVDFLARLNKPQLIAALKDATGVVPETAAKMKKDQLLEFVTREIDAVAPGWLPAPMRLRGMVWTAPGITEPAQDA